MIYHRRYLNNPRCKPERQLLWCLGETREIGRPASGRSRRRLSGKVSLFTLLAFL
jgi:hypothetical protein